MTDKVQKIKEFLIGMAGAACCDVKTKKNIETIILPFIDSLQEEPVSEDLEKAAIQFATDTETGKVDVVKQGSFFWGAIWKEQQFEKNRLKHCNSITNEQAELESDFIDQHLDKYQRMPTFLDAIEYGMRLQKEKMMAKAIDTEVCERITQNGLLPSISILANDCEPNQKVKVIVIKEV